MRRINIFHLLENELELAIVAFIHLPLFMSFSLFIQFNLFLQKSAKLFERPREIKTELKLN